MLAVVYNARNYVNGNNKQTSKSILTAMEISVSSWNELLHFVGGALEMGKCAWYLINWNFDSNDSPRMQETKEELNITMHDGTKMKSTQLKPNQVTIYLGVTSQVDGNQSAQTTILKNKVNKISRKLNCCHMPQKNDKSIMVKISKINLSKQSNIQINTCRLYLQVATLSDIVNPDGRTINNHFLEGNKPLSNPFHPQKPGIYGE